MRAAELLDGLVGRPRELHRDMTTCAEIKHGSVSLRRLVRGRQALIPRGDGRALVTRNFGRAGFCGHAKAVLDRRKDSSQVLSPLEVLLDNFVGVTATVADRA